MFVKHMLEEQHILKLLLAQQIVSDIQSLRCLLSDTAGKSLGHTHISYQRVTFWAGQ